MTGEQREFVGSEITRKINIDAVTEKKQMEPELSIPVASENIEGRRNQG